MTFKTAIHWKNVLSTAVGFLIVPPILLFGLNGLSFFSSSSFLLRLPLGSTGSNVNWSPVLLLMEHLERRCLA